MAFPATIYPRFLTVTPTPTRTGHQNSSLHHKHARIDLPLFLNLNSSTSRRSRAKHHQYHLINAIEEGQEENLSNSTTKEESDTEKALESSSELGSEIKEAMKTMKKESGSDDKKEDLWRGVAEEIREIEWPAFGKVLGTTGVVLGVIAGSSVVLLTVNAVLAELSDRIFAGRGVQDFFG